MSISNITKILYSLLSNVQCLQSAAYCKHYYTLLQNKVHHSLMLSTRQASADDKKNVSKCVKNVNILEFHDHIWNHHEKFIQISTNMPGIGSIIREISVKISEIGKAERL